MDDVHTPTSAGPPPAGAVALAPEVGSGYSATERPEVQVGAAFAGGLLAALILKRLAS
jgi:hypothetical protein